MPSAAQPASPTGPSPEERRKSQRVVLITQIECTATHDYTLGRSRDISEGGLLVFTTETFEPQTEVVVRFNLPPSPPGVPIEAQGVVVHVQPGEQLGIQFFELTDQQRQAIAQFIQQASAGTAEAPDSDKRSGE